MQLDDEVQNVFELVVGVCENGYHKILRVYHVLNYQHLSAGYS